MQGPPEEKETHVATVSIWRGQPDTETFGPSNTRQVRLRE